MRNICLNRMRKVPHAGQEQMVQELVALRQEVQQLRQMVNMLLDIVVEPEEDDDFGLDPTGKKNDKGGRPLMCM